jgi:type IV fimbrial biogenesis protein FimT
MLVTLAIAALLLSLAQPSLTRWLQRRHLLGASAQLLADVQLLRTSAVAQHRLLRLSFHDTGAGTCYLVHSGEIDDCQCHADARRTPQADCAPGTDVLRTHLLPTEQRIVLQSNVASLRVDPRHGTFTPTGSIDLVSADGRTSLRHVVNILGRVRLCSPGRDLPDVIACT